MDVFSATYFQNTVVQWLTAIGLTIVAFVVIQTVKRIILARLARLVEKTSNVIDDALVAVLRRTNPLVVLIVAAYFGTHSLTLPPGVVDIIKVVVTITFFLQMALWGTVAIDFFISRIYKRRRDEDPASVSAFTALSFFARMVLWTIVVFLILDNLGIDITTLVAGLGIGGIAVALAVQNILSDLFCSVAILVDKPFEVGDFIIVGDMLGTVEKIGIKTTRVRSLSGEQLIFANSDLVNSRIRNYKRMQQRRVVFSFGVIYETPADKLQQIPAMVKEIIESAGRTRFDRAHFKEYGNSSLDFECVYYVLEADYNLYMDVQQEINLALFRRFDQEGIEFAYPTSTLYIARESSSTE